MKFTLSWLKEHLDTDAVARRDRATRLTMLGLEVEGVDRPRRETLDALRRRLRRRGASSIPMPTGCGVCMVDTGSGDGAGRVRRAQRAHRHEGHLRAGRQRTFPAPA